MATSTVRGFRPLLPEACSGDGSGAGSASGAGAGSASGAGTDPGSGSGSAGGLASWAMRYRSLSTPDASDVHPDGSVRLWPAGTAPTRPKEHCIISGSSRGGDPTVSGQLCPECGTPRAALGRPGCGCAERAVQAVQAGRSEEIAASEDFHPLRIRPYVPVPPGGADEAGGAGGGGADEGGAEGATPPPPHAPPTTPDATAAGADADAPDVEDDRPTTALRVIAAPAVIPTETPAAATTAVLPVIASGPAHSTALVPVVSAPVPAPVPLYAPAPIPAPPSPPARRRSLRVAAIAAATVAVVGTAAFAGGLFQGGGERDTALPDSTSYAGQPDATATGADASASPSAPSSASGSGGTGTSATATESAPSDAATSTASPGTSAAASDAAGAGTGSDKGTGTSASGEPDASKSTKSAGTSGPSGSPGASKGATAPPGSDPDPTGATLRLGDSGAEVVELQQRLKQLWLFPGAANGEFDASVEEAVKIFQWSRNTLTDPLGVYGPDTRRALEAETKQGQGQGPGRGQGRN